MQLVYLYEAQNTVSTAYMGQFTPPVVQPIVCLWPYPNPANSMDMPLPLQLSKNNMEMVRSSPDNAKEIPKKTPLEAQQ